MKNSILFFFAIILFSACNLKTRNKFAWVNDQSGLDNLLNANLILWAHNCQFDTIRPGSDVRTTNDVVSMAYQQGTRWYVCKINNDGYEDTIPVFKLFVGEFTPDVVTMIQVPVLFYQTDSLGPWTGITPRYKLFDPVDEIYFEPKKVEFTMDWRLYIECREGIIEIPYRFNDYIPREPVEGLCRYTNIAGGSDTFNINGAKFIYLESCLNSAYELVPLSVGSTSCGKCYIKN